MISHFDGFVSSARAPTRLETVLRIRAHSLRSIPAGMRGPRVNVEEAQRESSFSRIHIYMYMRMHRAIAMDSALNIKPRAPRRSAVSIKTSPIFRAYNRSDAPPWYWSFAAADGPAFASPEDFFLTPSWSQPSPPLVLRDLCPVL